MLDQTKMYKGHRYVPKIMGEWNKQESYEGLSIVTNEGNSFTSKKMVPIGIELTNEDFWVSTGNYNAQIESYRQDVLDQSNDLLNYKNQTNDFMYNDINGINIEKSWGIKADTDQSAEFQTKVNLLPDNSILYFPNKTFVFNNINFINKKNIKLVGNVSKIINSSNDKNVFNFVDCENVKIEGFNIECTWVSFKSYETGQFIFADNINGLVVKNNTIVRGGITVFNSKRVSIDSNTLTDNSTANQYGIYARNNVAINILNNHITQKRSDGIKITLPLVGVNNAKDTLITGNHVSNCGQDCIDVFAGGLNCIVRNNFLRDSQRGVHAKAWGGDDGDYSNAENYAHKIIISENQIMNMLHDGIRVGSNDVIVTGNIVDQNSYGIYIQGNINNPVKNIKISNNMLKNSTLYSINSDAGTNDLELNSNHSENTGRYGYWLRSNNVAISNDIIIDSTDRGIQISPQTNDTNIVLSGVQIIRKNKEALSYGIRLSDIANLESLVVGCYTKGVNQPFQHDSLSNVKEFGNSWNIV